MYAIMAKASTFVPAIYSVYVEVSHYPNCGFKPTEKMVGRLGAAKNIEDARKLIANDKRAMGETYGGLIAPTRLTGRTYHIFKSVGGWEAAQ